MTVIVEVQKICQTLQPLINDVGSVRALLFQMNFWRARLKRHANITSLPTRSLRCSIDSLYRPHLLLTLLLPLSLQLNLYPHALVTITTSHNSLLTRDRNNIYLPINLGAIPYLPPTKDCLPPHILLPFHACML